MESALDESKALGDILETLLKNSPTLSELFLFGSHVANPFKTIKVRAQERPFEGKRFPTFFKFKARDYGTEYHRDCHINMRARIAFETDVANDYFSRDIDMGEFSLLVASGLLLSPVENYSLNLQNGIASLSVKLPATSHVGDDLRFAAKVTDRTQVDPFQNTFVLHVKEPLEAAGGGGKRRRPPADSKAGEEREISSGLQLPKRKKVYEAEWMKCDPPFDQYTALRIKHAGSDQENSGGDSENEIYDFFVNMDNVHLKRYLKHELGDGQDEAVTRTRFEVGLVLVGLAIIHQHAQKRPPVPEDESQERKEMNVEDQVAGVTTALAPFLLPMIDSLGAIRNEDISATEGAAEAV